MNFKRFSAWIGLLLGGGLIVLFVGRLDWGLFCDQLLSIQFLPAVSAVILIVFSTMLRSYRWFLLARRNVGRAGGAAEDRGDPAGAVSLTHFWRSTVLGYLGNMVYPARAGEMLRMFYLHRVSGLTAGRILVSSLADRLSDVAVLVAVGSVLAWRGTEGDMPVGAFAALAVGGAILVAGVLLCVLFREFCRNSLARLAGLLVPGKMHHCIRLFDQYVEGVMLLRSPKILVGAFACASGAIVVDGGACWFLMKAFGWQLAPFVGLVVLIYLTLGALLPAAPGFLGVYQAASVLALRPFGIPESGALAYAFTLQIILLCIFLVLGGGTLLHFVRERRRGMQGCDDVELERLRFGSE